MYDFLFVFNCNYVSILHRFRDVIAYFPKFKDVTWPWLRPFKGQFVIQMLNHHMANQFTKFEVFSCSHYGDILGVYTENLNGSRDHNHAPFRDGLSSVGWDYLRSSCVPNLKYLRSPLRRYEMRLQFGWFVGLWVTQGHRQHSHSIECIWLHIRL